MNKNKPAFPVDIKTLTQYKKDKTKVLKTLVNQLMKKGSEEIINL